MPVQAAEAPAAAMLSSTDPTSPRKKLAWTFLATGIASFGAAAALGAGSVASWHRANFPTDTSDIPSARGAESRARVEGVCAWVAGSIGAASLGAAAVLGFTDWGARRNIAVLPAAGGVALVGTVP
jgi:hypothetical protein